MQPWLRGLVVANATAAVLDDARSWRRSCGTRASPRSPASARALARHLPFERLHARRDHGAGRGGREPARRRRGRREPSRGSRPRISWARCRRHAIIEHSAAGRWSAIGIVDLGLKLNIVLAMRHRGARVRVLPHRVPDVRRPRPTSMASSCRPGRAIPARLGRPVGLAKPSSTTGDRCSGSAWATRSWVERPGAETTRLRFGHHGANHPVRDLSNLVSSRSPPRTMRSRSSATRCRRGSGFQVSQVNLNDGSVEGLRHRELPIETVQYHPEGAPGPLDALAVFDRFVAAAAGARRRDLRPGRSPRSVLILGSGPVVIGQAAEFDYAGTQACRALRGEGIRTILVEFQPRHDHDRPVGRRRDLPRAADRRGGRGRHRPRTARRPARRAGRPDRAQPRDRDGRRGRVRASPDPAAGHAARGDPDGRGPRGVPRPARADRPAVRPERDRRGRNAGRWEASSDAALETIGLPAIVRPAFTLGGAGGGIVETEPAYRERDPGRATRQPDGPGHIGRTLSRRVAGDRIRGHARRGRHLHRRVLDRRTSIRWASTPATRSWSHRSRP